MAYTQTPGREKLPPGNNIPDKFKQNNEPKVPAKTPTPEDSNKKNNAEFRNREIQNANSRLQNQQVNFNTKKRNGYSGEDKSQAKEIVSRGSIDSGGSSLNFVTNEEKVTPYGFNYVAPKNGVRGKVIDIAKKAVVKEASNSNSSPNQSTYSGSFKNTKITLSENQLYQGYVKDSIDDQTRKRLNLNVKKNTQEVAGS